VAAKRQRRSTRRRSGSGEVPLSNDPPFTWKDIGQGDPKAASGGPLSGTEPAEEAGGSRFGAAGAGPPPTTAGAGAGAGPKRRVARRARADRGPKVVAGVVAVMVVGALVGALWGGSVAPTGNGWVDAFERAALVALGALAGSRARRWPLFTIAVLASMLAQGVGLAMGLGAVTAATVLLTIDRRNWVVGAAAGAAVTLALMELRPVGPLGFTALIGVVLYLAMCASGYQQMGSAGQRRARLGALGTAAVLVVGLVVAGGVLLGMVNPMQSAVDNTRRGAAAVRDGETAGATELLNEASVEFGDTADRLGALWLAPARLVPGVAQNLDALRTGATMGRDLNSSAAFAATSVDYQALRQKGGGVNLAQLEATQVPVAALASSLNAAVDGLSGLDSPWVVAPLRTRLDEVAGEVGDLSAETELAQLALADAPSLLGADGPRRYMVMVGNPAEGRDFGGFMGGWALLRVDNGDIGLEESGTALDLWGPDLDRPPPSPLTFFPPAFLEMAPGRYPQNWTSSADLDVVAAAATNLLEANGHGKIDGVIYADPAALAEFVALTGPIPVPGTVAEINATNTEAFFTRDQFQVLSQDEAGDEAIGDLTGEIFDRLGSADLPGPARPGRRLRSAGARRSPGDGNRRGRRPGPARPAGAERTAAPDERRPAGDRGAQQGAQQTGRVSDAKPRLRRGLELGHRRPHRHAELDLHQRRGRSGPAAAGGGGQPDRRSGGNPDPRGVGVEPLTQRKSGGGRRADPVSPGAGGGPLPPQRERGDPARGHRGAALAPGGHPSQRALRPDPGAARQRWDQRHHRGGARPGPHRDRPNGGARADRSSQRRVAVGIAAAVGGCETLFAVPVTFSQRSLAPRAAEDPPHA
jgi:hypothetical protein